MREQAPYVDVVLGTHNVHRAAELIEHARARRPDHGDLRRGGARRPGHVPVSALPARRETTLQRLGHDPDRLRQLVRVLHRAGRARRGDQPAVRRCRRRGRSASPPRASPRSPCSARTSTATAATCSCRLARQATTEARLRPLFAELLRAVGAVAGHPPRALHQPAPEGHARRDVRGDGRRRRPCASTCTTRCSPAATACWRRCTAATPRERYLERLAAGRAAVDDLAVSTDIIVGFPGETDDDFAAHARGRRGRRVRLRLHVHLLARGRAPRRPTMADRFVEPAVAAERFERLRVVVERSALAKHRGPRRPRSKRSSSKARARRIPRSCRAAPARTSSCTSRRRRRCAPAPTPPSRSPGAAPHHLVGRFVEVVAEPLHKRRIAVLAG